MSSLALSRVALRGGDRSRRRLWGLVFGGMCGVALAVAGVSASGPTGAPEPEPFGSVAADGPAVAGMVLVAQVDAYDEAIAGPIEDAGFAVANGLKPGLGDILYQEFDDQTLTTMAEGWLASLRAAHEDLAALETPPALAPVAALYDDAFGRYVETAEVALAAAGATGDERAGLIDQAADLGEAADDAFDRAKDGLARLRTTAAGDGSAGNAQISSVPEEDT